MALSLCCFGCCDQMPHLMSKEDACADALEAVRGVEMRGLRVVAIDYKAYALMSLRERPLA